MSRHVSFCRFVASTLGVELTPAQRVLAAVAFDRVEPQDLPPDDREIARELFGDVDVFPPEARNVLALVKGARIGGSYIFVAFYSLWRALTADLTGLAAGERASAVIIAPDQRLGRQALRYCSGAIAKVPAIARLVQRSTADAVELRRPDGHAVAIETLPATRGGVAGRGRTLVSAALDETAFFRSEEFTVNDQEVFRAVEPRIIDGGMCVLSSTPWGEIGLLFNEFQHNFDNPTSAIACRAPTLLMRPSLRMRAIVARERFRDEENARREFDAQFLASGAGQFFERDTIKASAIQGAEPLDSPEYGWTAYAGADLGLSRDRSALCIVHRTGSPPQHRHRIAELVELRPERSNPLDLRQVVATFATRALQHGCHEIVCDNYLLAVANQMATEHDSLSSCRFVACAPPGENFGKARDAFRGGRVAMPVGPAAFARLREQLALVTSTPTSAGGLSIKLPRTKQHGHCDLASALVVALAKSESTAAGSIDWRFSIGFGYNSGGPAAGGL